MIKTTLFYLYSDYSLQGYPMQSMVFSNITMSKEVYSYKEVMCCNFFVNWNARCNYSIAIGNYKHIFVFEPNWQE